MCKRICLIVVLAILVSSPVLISAADTSSVKYMPLRVGDYWVYNTSRWNFGGQTNYISTIHCTQSVEYNGRSYFYLTSTNHELLEGYFRVDTITGSLYIYDQSNGCPFYYCEKLYDSLSAVINDSTRNCAKVYKCNGIIALVFANRIWTKKMFTHTYQGMNYGGSDTKTYIKYIGLYNIYANDWGPEGTYWKSSTLKGCKVSGINYGDTSLVFTGIRNPINSLPPEYMICQNYPNPFNPVTNIKFDIPISSSVKITVFDITGKEIETLVNQDMQPGTYETSWDASKYSNGIYFCKIQAGEFNQTRKMMLLK